MCNNSQAAGEEREVTVVGAAERAEEAELHADDEAEIEKAFSGLDSFERGLPLQRMPRSESAPAFNPWADQNGGVPGRGKQQSFADKSFEHQSFGEPLISFGTDLDALDDARDSFMRKHMSAQSALDGNCGASPASPTLPGAQTCPSSPVLSAPVTSPGMFMAPIMSVLNAWTGSASPSCAMSGAGAAMALTALQNDRTPEELQMLADEYCRKAEECIRAAAIAKPSEAGTGMQASSAYSCGISPEAVESVKPPYTTVMIRNLPNDYERDMLVELLDKEGFNGKYDFLYLPVDFKRWAGLGYAFVNMINHDEALRIRDHFSNWNDWAVASRKVCEVTWAEPLQGLEQHLDRYKNSPIMHDDAPDKVKPLLFENGVRMPFPPPTKRIRPPREGRLGWRR